MHLTDWHHALLWSKVCLVSELLTWQQHKGIEIDFP